MALFFSKQEAAERLGCSVVTVDKLRRKGELSFHKVGALIKFTEKDIEEYIARSAVTARHPVREARP
jgi:excisionase family DNA binding protein